jgi:hypothetical protein
MSSHADRVEVFAGIQRRRRYSADQKLAVLQEAAVDIIDSRPILQQLCPARRHAEMHCQGVHRVTNVIYKVALRIWTSTADKVRFWT